MFQSLRIRLTILFVGLTILPLVIVGSLIALRGFDTLQQESVKFQNQVARQVSVSLKDFFSERQNELLTLTRVSGIGLLPSDGIKTVFLSLLSKQPAYYQLTMAKADGQQIVQSIRGQLTTTNNAAVNYASDPLFQSAVKTNKVSFSQVRFNDTARDRLVTIAVPIEDLFTGTVSNVLIAEVRFQNVEEAILRDTDLIEGEDIFIVDRDGVVIAHRNPGLVINETIFKLPKGAGRGVGLDGQDVILALNSIQLEGLQMTVVANTGYANATALASDLTRIASIITVVALLIASIVVIFVVTRVVNPIVKLSTVAKAIQGGDFSQQAEISGRDEIGRLGQAFNSMTAQLRQTLKGLQDYVAELERAKVERENLIRDLETAKSIAEENSRLKSEFLSTMSHELRTPLNAIEGFTAIILNKLGGTDFNGKTEEFLTRIRSNSKRLLSLINDFLDLSRIEAGRLELANQPFSPIKLAQRWQTEIGIMAEKKGVQFIVKLDPALPETVYGDEEAVSKVALNLLSNAIKFTEEGQIALALERNGNSWGFTIEDTGIGIPPHAREFIFEEFRQVDQTSKRKYGGTGLGLAIVQKYARAMGGTVTVKSELGKGSTFSVSLPLKLTA